MTCLLIRENEARPIAENDRQSKQNPRLYVEVCYSPPTPFSSTAYPRLLRGRRKSHTGSELLRMPCSDRALPLAITFQKSHFPLLFSVGTSLACPQLHSISPLPPSCMPFGSSNCRGRKNVEERRAKPTEDGLLNLTGDGARKGREGGTAP